MANCAGIERKWATSCGCFEARTDVLRRNKSAFVFLRVLILFILHANAPIRDRNVKKDIRNTGYGGSTVTKTSYSNICRLASTLQAMFVPHLVFTIWDKVRGRNTNTNMVTSTDMATLVSY